MLLQAPVSKGGTQKGRRGFADALYPRQGACDLTLRRVQYEIHFSALMLERHTIRQNRVAVTNEGDVVGVPDRHPGFGVRQRWVKRSGDRGSL